MIINIPALYMYVYWEVKKNKRLGQKMESLLQFKLFYDLFSKFCVDFS